MVDARINYRVYTKTSKSSPWKDTGIIESNREAAKKYWKELIDKLGHYDFKFEYCMGGICAER